MPEPERQTCAHLKRLLDERGLSPRHDLGQNFLIDLNLLEIIVQEAQLSPSDLVLEVGTGTGSLTAYLAAQAGHVVTVEYDPKLFELASTTIAATNITFLNCDVLHNKNRLADEVLQAVRSHMTEATSTLKLVANLPYHVGTPVIANLMASDLPWSRMVVTIQRELADRILAKPETREYSGLSIWLQSQAKIELLRMLPSSVFWPRPNVESAIVKLDRDVEQQGRIQNREFFQKMLRDIFTQRRKAIGGVLKDFYGQTRETWEPILTSLGIDVKDRAERLPVASLVELSNRIEKLIIASPETRR